MRYAGPPCYDIKNITVSINGHWLAAITHKHPLFYRFHLAQGNMAFRWMYDGVPPPLLKEIEGKGHLMWFRIKSFW